MARCVVALDLISGNHVLPWPTLYPHISFDNINCPKCFGQVTLDHSQSNGSHFIHICEKTQAFCGRIRPHEIAKWAIQAALIAGIRITIDRCCHKCKQHHHTALPPYMDFSVVRFEHGITVIGRQRSADVAYFPWGIYGPMHNIEIFHSSRTSETDRVEPWYELSAGAVLLQIERGIQTEWNLSCIRNEHRCRNCTFVPSSAVCHDEIIKAPTTEQFYCGPCDYLFADKWTFTLHQRMIKLHKIKNDPHHRSKWWLKPTRPIVDSSIHQAIIKYLVDQANAEPTYENKAQSIPEDIESLHKKPNVKLQQPICTSCNRLFESNVGLSIHHRACIKQQNAQWIAFCSPSKKPDVEIQSPPEVPYVAIQSPIEVPSAETYSSSEDILLYQWLLQHTKK